MHPEMKYEKCFCMHFTNSLFIQFIIENIILTSFLFEFYINYISVKLDYFKMILKIILIMN